jgi:hypothetical protein
MGKHGSYPRVHRDFYPTPARVVQALAETIDLVGRRTWEPAAGTGQLATALRLHGAKVYATDIQQRGFPLAQVMDFVTAPTPAEFDFDSIITNPPFGKRGQLAEKFIEVGLHHTMPRGGMLALLLPVDFDSAKSRRKFFGDCPNFMAKIVLTQRIVWFEHAGKRANPKENSAWFIWQCPLLQQIRQQPIVLYAPR